MPRHPRQKPPSLEGESSSRDGDLRGAEIPAAASTQVRAGALYIVSTTIGNADDISVRALRILKSVALIVAETAAITRDLLRPYQIDTPVIALRPPAVDEVMQSVLSRLLAGDSIALVSDAGTPMVADPGLDLARAALKQGVPLIAVPGAIAAMAALVVSGLPPGRFAFDGFPPRGRSDRIEFFRSLVGERRTVILYESRRWLRDTLYQLVTVLDGRRRVLIARNLTRHSETLFYGTIEQALQSFSRPLNGEYTLVVSGLDGMPSSSALQTT